MKYNESREMYLEVIYDLSKENKEVMSIDVAKKFGYSKPSVSKAISVLKDEGFVHKRPYGPIFLTEKGRVVAKLIKSKHEYLTKFLTCTLDLDKESAESDACRIEHIVSRTTMLAIQDYVDENVGNVRYYTNP